MRVRDIIEHGTKADVEDGLPYSLSTIDAEGDDIGGSSRYATIEEAKKMAESSGNVRKWSNPPTDWVPDVITVSNYYDDEGWDNR